MTMRVKKTVIVGGSIAGCTIAILLQRLGFDVTVLERSSGLINHGSGIILPTFVVEECIALDLFDESIPRLPICGRSFSRKENANNQDQTIFWTQPMHVVALNWLHVYQNLRARIDKSCYHIETTVQDIHQQSDAYNLQTSTGIDYQASLVIAADGVDSGIRRQLMPSVLPQYTGYVAWRGLLDAQSILEQNDFQEHVPYFVFPNGHILLYRVPAKDYVKTRATCINWLLYENRQGEGLNNLLIDKYNKQHTRSLPQGLLSKQKIDYLHELANQVLPSAIADIICQTNTPFLQAIFDFQLPSYDDSPILFIGDAAATLRPHTGSGVYKALTNGIDLVKLIQNGQDLDLSALVFQWKEMQQHVANEEIPKAIAMGRALVTEPPDWTIMNQASMDHWWTEIMQGKTWYATKTT